MASYLDGDVQHLQQLTDVELAARLAEVCEDGADDVLAYAVLREAIRRLLLRT